MDSKRNPQLTVSTTSGIIKDVVQIYSEQDVLVVQFSTSNKLMRLSEEDRSQILEQYLAWLGKTYSRLQMIGIPVPHVVGLRQQQKIVGMKLDDVFIRLRAVSPYRIETPHVITSQISPPNSTDADVLRGIIDTLQSHRYDIPSEPSNRSPFESDNPNYAEPINPETKIKEQNNLVLIGGPGSGKSTLLKYITWSTANIDSEYFFLFVPLGKLDIRMVETKLPFLEAVLDVLSEHKIGDDKEKLQAVLLWLMSQRRVRFLFDGLDEVHVHRQEVRDALEGWRADGHKIVVTSRPTGYEHLAGYDLYEVLPLLPEDAQAFTHKWFKSLAKTRRLPVDTIDDWVARRAKWLQTQITERPALQELARIPLFLTFLAILAGDEPQADLPRKRPNLYQAYLERLVTSWEMHHRKQKKLAFGSFAGEHAHKLALWSLFFVALQLQKAYYGSEKYQLPSRTDVMRLLASALMDSWGITRNDAEPLSSELLMFWREAGMLESYQIGEQDWLIFRHLTFQEYGAARMLAESYENHENELWWLYLRYYVNNPQWAEVIPLTLAHLSEAAATFIVEQLLEWDLAKPFKERFNRNRYGAGESPPMFLAAHALADGTKVRRSLEIQVIGKLITEVEEGPREDPLDIFGVRRDPFGFLEKTDHSEILSIIAGFDKNNDVISGLIAVSRDANLPPNTRKNIAKALLRFGEKVPATEILRGVLLDTTSDARVRWEVAETLHDLGSRNEALRFLRELVRDTNTPMAERIGAAETLTRLGQSQEGLIFLIDIGRNISITDTDRLEAAQALARCGHKENALVILQEMGSRDIGEVAPQIEAAKLLWSLGSTDEALGILHPLIFNRILPVRDRWTAISAYARFHRSQEIIDILVELALDEQIPLSTRCEAIEILASIGESKWAVEILLELDSFHSTAEERLRIADLLCTLGKEMEGHRIALEILKNTGEKIETRLEAARILAKTGAIGTAATWISEQLKSSTTTDLARWAIVRLIIKLGWRNLVSDALRGLSVTQGRNISAEFSDLLRMAEDTDLASIAQRKDLDYAIRYEIVSILLRRDRFTESETILGELIQDTDAPIMVRLDAAILLATIGKSDPLLQLARQVMGDSTYSISERRYAIWLLISTGGAEPKTALYDLARESELEFDDRLHLISDLYLLDEADYATAQLVTLASEYKPTWALLWILTEKLRLFGDPKQLVEILTRFVDTFISEANERQTLNYLFWPTIGVLSTLDTFHNPHEFLLNQANTCKALTTTLELPNMLIRLGFPEKAIPLFHMVADDSSVHASIRSKAIEALLRLGQIELTKELLLRFSQDRLLTSSSRTDIASRLAILGEEELASSLLISLIYDGSSSEADRYKALDSLARLSRLQEMYEVVQDESLPTSIRVHSSLLLADSGDLRSTEELLPAILATPNIAGRLRYQIAECFIKSDRLENAVSILIEIIRDRASDSSTITNSAELLAKTGRVIELKQLARNTQIPVNTRVQVAKSLASLEDKAALQVFEHIVTNHYSNPPTLMSVGHILAELGHTENACPIFARIACDPAVDAQTRKNAINRLQQLRATAALLGIVQDENAPSTSKQMAYQSLVGFQTIEILRHLVGLQNIELERRIGAAKELLRQGDMTVLTTFLIPTAENSANVPSVRLDTAILAAQNGRGNRVEGILVELAGDSNVGADIRISAVSILEELNLAPTEIAIDFAARIVSEGGVEKEHQHRAIDFLAEISAFAELHQIIHQEMLSTDTRLHAAIRLVEKTNSDSASETILQIIETGRSNVERQLEAAEVFRQVERINEAVSIASTILKRSDLGTSKDKERSVNILVGLRETSVLLELSLSLTAHPQLQYLLADGLNTLGKVEKAVSICYELVQRTALASRHQVTSPLQRTSPPKDDLLTKIFELLVKNSRTNELRQIACGQWIMPHIRLRAAEALAHAGKAEDALDVLKALAQDITVAISLRIGSASALLELQQFGVASIVAVQVLRDPTCPDPSAENAVQILVRQSKLQELVSLLQSRTTHDRVKVVISKALISAGLVDQIADNILQMAANEKTAETARQAAITLLRNSKRYEELLSLSRSTQQKSSVRFSALYPVPAEIDMETILDILLDLGQDDTLTDVQKYVLGEFLQRKNRFEEASDIFLRLANIRRKPEVKKFGNRSINPQIDAVKALATMKQGNLLENLLCSKEAHKETRLLSGKMFADISTSSATSILSELMNDDSENSEIRVGAAALLAEVSNEHRETVLTFCLEVAKSNTSASQIAVETLTDMNCSAELLTLATDASVNASVKIHIARQLFRLRMIEPAVQTVENIITAQSHSEDKTERPSTEQISAITLLTEHNQLAVIRNIALNISISSHLRTKAIEELLKQKEAEIFPEFCDILTHNPEIPIKVRVNLAKALIASGHVDITILALIEMINTFSAFDSAACKDIIRLLSEARRSDELLELLSDESCDLYIRYLAAEALSEWGDHSDVVAAFCVSMISIIPQTNGVSQATEGIVTATQNMPRGLVIPVSGVEKRAFPDQSVQGSSGYFTDAKDVVGRIARTDILRGAPIRRNQVVDNLLPSYSSNPATTSDDTKLQMVKLLKKLNRSTELEQIAVDASIDFEVRLEAFKAVSRDMWSESLQRVLRDMVGQCGTDPNRMLAVGRLLVNVGDVSQASDLLVRTARQTSSGQKSMTKTSLAREAMTLLREIKQVEALRSIISTPGVDYEIRKQALDELIKSGDFEEKNRILSTLARDAKLDSDTRYDALLNMISLGHAKDAISIAKRIIKTPSAERGLHQRAVDILVELNESELLNELAQEEKMDPMIQAYILERSTRFGNNNRIINELRKLISDEKKTSLSRVQALKTLSKLVEIENPPPLLISVSHAAAPDSPEWAETINEIFSLLGNLRVDPREIISDTRYNIHLRLEAVRRTTQSSDLREISGQGELDENLRLAAAIRVFKPSALEPTPRPVVSSPFPTIQAFRPISIRQTASGVSLAEDPAFQILSSLAQAPNIQARIRYAAAELLAEKGLAEVAVTAYHLILDNNAEQVIARLDAAKALGDIFSKQNDWLRASSYYSGATSFGDRSDELFAKLGKCYVELRDFEKAISAYREAIRSNPDRPDILWEVGNLYSRLGKRTEATNFYGQAAPYYRQGIAVKPNDISSWVNLGRIERLLENEEASASAYARVMALCSPQLRPKYIKEAVDAFLAAREFELYKIYLNEYYEKEDNSEFYIQLALGDVELMQGHFAEAIVHFHRALVLEPTSQLCQMKLVQCLLFEGNENEADIIIRQVLENIPRSAWLLWQIGISYIQRNRHEVGIGYIRESLRINPNLPAELISQARSSFPTDKQLLEILAGREIATREAAVSYMCLGVGMILFEAEQEKQGIELLQRAIQLDKGNLEAWQLLSEAQRIRGAKWKALIVSLGQHKQTARQFIKNRAKYGSPVHLRVFLARSFCNRGKAYLDSGDYKRAIRNLNWAIRLDHENADAYFSAGIACRRLGRYAEAVSAYQKSVDLDPTRALDCHWNMTIAARLGGLFEQALQSLLYLLENANAIEHKVQFDIHCGLISVYEHLGNNVESEKHSAAASELLSNVSPYGRACFEAIVGNTEAAITALSEAAKLPEFDAEWAAIDPDFDKIRQDSRFQELVMGTRT